VKKRRSLSLKFPELANAKTECMGPGRCGYYLRGAKTLLFMASLCERSLGFGFSGKPRRLDYGGNYA
jgi:hypothetical protein